MRLERSRACERFAIVYVADGRLRIEHIQYLCRLARGKKLADIISNLAGVMELRVKKWSTCAAVNTKASSSSTVAAAAAAAGECRVDFLGDRERLLSRW